MTTEETARPSYYLVEGADGRKIGRYSPDELHAFKGRIRHLVKHGLHRRNDERAHGPRERERLPVETFTITPLDRDRQPCGDPKSWAVEE
jgi:hypothetical protein